MHDVEPRARRAQLLIGGALRRAAVACAAACAAAGCAPEAPFEPDPAAAAALDYLETTTDELGVDVLAAVQIYGAETGDPRAGEVVRARAPDLRPSDLARYGPFLELDKPVRPPRSLAGVAPPRDVPDPAHTLSDDRVARCPEQMLECVLGEGCEDFLTLDGWGYVLTHQALALLVADWAGCTLPAAIDRDALAARYAARLRAEASAHPFADDLFFERLAMLAHLGFASEIAPSWIAALRAAQRPEGCFPAGPTVPCHPHPTGLALWTLGVLASSE